MRHCEAYLVADDPDAPGRRHAMVAHVTESDDGTITVRDDDATAPPLTAGPDHPLYPWLTALLDRLHAHGDAVASPPASATGQNPAPSRAR